MNSCSLISKKDVNKDIVARAYDKYLYKSDLENVIPSGISFQDSLSLTKNYIDKWVRQEVILHKAEHNLTDELTNVSKQLEDYKSSLLIYAYQKELIEQKLDTVVLEEEIESYYNNNQDNFELKDNIIKVLYLKLDKNAVNLNKVRQWYRSNNPKDRILLEKYCYQYAVNFFLDDTIWLLFDDLLKEIPIKTYDKEQFLKNNRFIEIEDSTGIYLVNIKGFRIKDSKSPLSFEKENIRNLILNKRKLTLIEDIERKAYEEAIKKNEFEIY